MLGLRINEIEMQKRKKKRQGQFTKSLFESSEMKDGFANLLNGQPGEQEPEKGDSAQLMPQKRPSQAPLDHPESHSQQQDSEAGPHPAAKKEKKKPSGKKKEAKPSSSKVAPARD